MSSESYNQSLHAEESAVEGDNYLAEIGVAISVQNLSKVYQIYDRPEDRLKQSIYPRFNQMIGRQPKAYYREFWALKNICFDVKKGETVGIVGRNGSGKSTLLQLICGTLQPSEGVVETNGRVAALLELGSGFNPEFTGRENVYMNASILGLSKDEVDQRFDEIAAFANIGQFIDQPVKTYSSGMMVRLAFSVAINVDPEILIVDEALSVGDELFQRKCFSRIEAIKNSGATILFVSHSGGTVVELCDRAVLLDAGEKLAIGRPKVIVGHYHKLLFASPEKHEAIRQDIQEMGYQSSTSANAVPITANNRATHSKTPQARETLDPNIKPASTIVYDSRGANIQQAKILTLNGEQVNNLLRGGVYIFSYLVKFDRNSMNVRFGMLLKTTSGIELGGGASASASGDGIEFISAGEHYQVEFRFNCNLSPGMYFLNAGVLGSDNEEEVYLQRIIDVVAFRVLPEASYLGTGMVDFGCYSEIRRVSPEKME